MSTPILVAKNESEIHLLPSMANRHGLIAGATGTGKTVTLQRLAEGFSRIGVPVFMADVKGDLAGISHPGGDHPKIVVRMAQLGLEPAWAGCPVAFWDVFGKSGHPLRTTVSEMGPLLLARLLELNETQEGVLNIVFRVADERGWLLLDLKDLRAMLQHCAEHAREYATQYGNVSAASVGAIQRALLTLENQGAAEFFGEPALDLDDLMQTVDGRGVVNLLSADRLLQAPRLYATSLLWLLAELFERLPEAGDLEKPKLVFFFDEAHLLFRDAPSAFVDKVEQVVRLIRSKGVGVYFVTQSPRDVPDRVLGQLGNRVQHAMRAFTPADQKIVRAAAETFRSNPALDTTAVLTELGIGEALVSCLDTNGQPGIVQRAFVVPPGSALGPITSEARIQIMATSLVAGVYEQEIDRESAYEKLAAIAAAKTAEVDAPKPRAEPMVLRVPATAPAPRRGTTRAPAPRETAVPRRPPGRPRDTLIETMAKSTVRTIGTTLGRQIVRGLLGSLFGGKGKR
ncbi:DUF853 domain-containing protein [Opitutales bacterium ASA1]|uniref:helicase HerA-like domain-containing protein n=1 Tax=Congregicoccus parvus TaxID=3081749 RepID=UPI002B2B6B4B|nr:DUF853 domain-containing protein [Opitutales bacterium ASA1]